MWFDAFAKLVEIVAPPCDIRDNCDTGRQFSNYCDVSVITVSQLSQVSQRPPRESQNPSPAPKPSGMAYLSRGSRSHGRAALFRWMIGGD